MCHVSDRIVQDDRAAAESRAGRTTWWSIILLRGGCWSTQVPPWSATTPMPGEGGIVQGICGRIDAGEAGGVVGAGGVWERRW